MGCYWFQGGARTKSWNDILIFLAMLCIIPACSSLIYTLIQVMQQVSQTLSCMMQWSFNLKWEFCQIFILVVSLVNCCRLQHLQHVFYPRITGINHDLMLRLNSYRQAIYSWLACSILCKNTVWLCVSVYWHQPLLTDNSHSLWSSLLLLHLLKCLSFTYSHINTSLSDRKRKTIMRLAEETSI